MMEKRYKIKNVIKEVKSVKKLARALLIVLFVMFPIWVYAGWTNQPNAIDPEKAGGWTPTDAGLVVQLNPGDQFRLSTVINGKEYFVCDYSGYTGGDVDTEFKYNNTDNFLKLIPRDDGEYPAGSKWTVGAPLKSKYSGNEYDLVKGIDGIIYTMTSDANPAQTPRTPLDNKDNYIFNGDLTTILTNDRVFNVVFAIPTVRARFNMDPNGTLNTSHTAEGRTRGTGDNSWAFDGKMGVDAKGNVWREVYWFHKTRINGPFSYAAFGLTAFNTSGNNKGRAYQINGKTTGQNLQRMLFRLYIVKDHPFETCPNSYYFAHDEQNYLKFLKFTSTPIGSADSTAARKIYTHDYFHCMERIGDTKYYQTELHQIAASDSIYFYVGKNNQYYSDRAVPLIYLNPGGGALSQFTKIRQLRVRELAGAAQTFTPAAGAMGRFVIDTTSREPNLGVAFDPAGYFFRIKETGRNVEMRQVDDSTWITNEAWTIDTTFMKLSGKVMLCTQSSFSAADPGAEIVGWSKWQKAPDIPVYGQSGTAEGHTGWARIHTNRTDSNGGIEFVLADANKCIRYHNNGHFGVDIPDLHPLADNPKVLVQNHMLLGDYDFSGWNTEPDGSGTMYQPGNEIDLNTIAEVDGKRILNLYAQAMYKGDINVAISFLKENGKRYFITYNGGTPRYMRVRTFEEWTDTWQGMGNSYNTEPNYLTTFKLHGKHNKDIPCAECDEDEYVLDMHSLTQHGSKDSLVFYENYQPQTDEYPGLYFETYSKSASYTVNTLLTNNSWAGLFVSTQGWPTPAHSCVDSTRIYSDFFLTNWPENEKNRRAIPDPEHPGDSIDIPSELKYIPETDQFDGAEESYGTDFMISGVGVVDEHYVILPDTTDDDTPWKDSIIFAFHENQQTIEDVWSELIGKQLLAQMKVGKDTIYFHPNRDKIFTTANALTLSQDFRLTQAFQYIHDARVEALKGDDAVDHENKPSIGDTDNAFHCTITSGESSPKNVKVGGNYIDIVDTLRVWLQPNASSKIKAYYGRWKTGAEGVHVQSNGYRYRDILVKTKTYHYTDTVKTLRLVPEQEQYNFGSLDNESKDVNFTLELVSTHKLVDKDGNLIRVDTFSIADTTSILDLRSATTFTLKRNDVFTMGEPTRLGIRLTTKYENTTAPDRDTLFVSTTVDLGGTPTQVTTQVPLMQVSTIGTELIWSVGYGDARYFIMGANYNPSAQIKDNNNLRIQTFTINNNQRLVRNGKELIFGSWELDRLEDRQHIRPWKWFDTDPDKNQLTLKTEYDINRWFHISGETPEASSNDSTILTFYLYDTHTNDNGNYEEIVKLQYGDNQWLSFNGSALVLVEDSADACVFSWAYMRPEYYIQNNSAYPSERSIEFGYNTNRAGTVQTRYMAYLDYSMLLNNQSLHLCKTEEKDIADLINSSGDWKTQFTDSIIRDSRVATPSGLSIAAIDTTTLLTTISQTGSSPMGVMYNGQYVNIVDTLDFRIKLQEGAPEYRFAGDWSSYSSIEDAHLKIPLIRKTYHETIYDTVVCVVDKDEYNYAFPAVLPTGPGADSTHTFTLSTEWQKGRRILDVNNNQQTDIVETPIDLTDAMDFTSISMAEIRLRDDFGKKPTWCSIIAKDKHSITVKCYSNGIRTPRMAYIDFAYVVMADDKMRFVSFRLTVSQASYFQYENNQTLFHSAGASGDPLMPDGRQYAHENKRILYYYNPKPYHEADQNVELPLRERGYYGWWRWYREGKDEYGKDVSDTDIPDSLWITPPRNVGGEGKKYDYGFRIIGDSVPIYDNDSNEIGKKLATMGRYTVFHYPSRDYNNKPDPAAKTPQVHAPINKDTVTYVVDISNYYDNLPLSTKEGQKNQIDTALLERMDTIIEPTLSLREIYELHPWTEMAARLDSFKVAVKPSGVYTNEKYMEDHVVMAPTGNPLLLQTEQRYTRANLAAQYENNKLRREGHSESLLGYYMRDDHWSDGDWDEDRKDTMIWCGGWDANCVWFTYNPTTHTYDTCHHSLTLDDFLKVPAKSGISAGHEFDTVYYCLRARSWATTGTPGDNEETVEGDYIFNICRYMIIYHYNDNSHPDNNRNKYGPLLERKVGGVMKALKTNDEIEQDYEILEQLNFDYNKPGYDYTVYPHPLPWSDGSYGYSYPLSSSALPNRFHKQTDFPGPGEYALINRIPEKAYWGETFWRPIEQHGGAENGYMIYCDGMSASGQVAALSLQTKLCEGQKLYFSGYVSNVSSQNGKSNPNFTFTVQGSMDGNNWEDITSYMTGEITPNNNWYQILFPIEFTKEFTYFRVRIYNLSSDYDGNDFAIDDMCLFATKPPLIAYQAQTKCVEQNETDSIIHVVLRVDYQGFVDDEFNNKPIYYTVEQLSLPDSTLSFVPMMDGYQNNTFREGADESKPDTVLGWIRMPARTYDPDNTDSIFMNLNLIAHKFEESYTALEAWEKSDKSTPQPQLFRQGYIYENLDGGSRPVLYVVHKAKMTPNNKYTVRMATNTAGLMSSECAVTSILPVTSRMKLMLNGDEQESKQVSDICGNVTHDLSLRVRGTLIQDNTAPVDLAGTCVSDWLLYGDTAEESSLTRYGYKYSDIEKVVKDILRYEPMPGETNVNQFARSLGSVSRATMNRIKKSYETTEAPKYLETDDDPYDVLSKLVNNGFLVLYQSNLMVTMGYGDSVQYVIFPILGTGSDEMHNQNMDVCPNPLVIKLKSRSNVLGAPMIVGGLNRDSTQLNKPVIALADAITVSEGILIPVDSIRSSIGVKSVKLLSTDDPNYRPAIHRLEMTPDKTWPSNQVENYYHKGDTILLTPSSSNNYSMRQGYNYTFNMEMVTILGISTEGEGDCPIGDVPLTISYVPSYLRWAPQSAEDSSWNNVANWIGIDNQNKTIIHEDARFAPLPSTKVIIPAMEPGMPYPVIPKTITSKDSVQEVGFKYNTCETIRFLPGAAIGKQHNLVCDEAIVDMSLPHDKWALRSAPVKGLLTGDMFMAEADLAKNSDPWVVGEFDAAGRTNTTGNAAFWQSLYSSTVVKVGNSTIKNDTLSDDGWSKVTNSLTLPIPTATGWAVYTRTKSAKDAAVRLPKNDDRYYYYYANGDRADDYYEDNLREKRGDGAGELAYQPAKGSAYQNYTLTKASDESGFFVFGNPTMGYIDIWGFIHDNDLQEEFRYIGSDGLWHTVTSATAETARASKDTISDPKLYLPPMHAMVVEAKSATNEKDLRLDTTRVVTAANQIERPLAAPSRNTFGCKKGIMTVTATNAASNRCTTRLLLGQGYSDAIRKGEDAILTTVNIDKYSTTAYPATPFNIYAAEEGYGLSIDLRDSIVNVPLSFYMTNVSFAPVTYLWFTGVSAIDGPLVLYDALTDTERKIIDGICLDIETPEMSHQRRYYIRRPGYSPEDPNPVATGLEPWSTNDDQAVKYIHNGIVYILRKGHLYTVYGQKVR